MNTIRYFRQMSPAARNFALYARKFAVLLILLVAPSAFGQMIIMQEDFESGQGGWGADNGVWEIGMPTVVGPDSCHSGKNCAGTILNNNYPPNANTRLISPQIVLPPVSGNEKIRLYFWHWFAMDEVDALGPDVGRVQISVNGGTFQPLAGSSGPFSGFGVVWTQVYIDLTAYANSQIRLAFHFTSTQRDQAAGWYIDDVLIIKKSSAFNPPLESFETGIGDWHADNGVWEVGKPTGSPANAYEGKNCAATVLRGDYPANANTRLVSPEFDLPPLIAPARFHLHFWHWFVTNEEDALGPDEGRVQLSVNNGPWENISGPFAGSSAVWTHVSVDLSKYAGMRVRLAFYFTSTQRDQAPGWFVDDISFHSYPNQFNLTNNPENFELGIGEWWVDNGVWEVGHPTSGPLNGYNSPNCAGTILGGAYPNLANTRLISPEFKFGKSPVLSFRHWFRMNNTDALGSDQGYVQISVRRGPWKNIAGPYSGISDVWTQPPPLDLAAYADSTVRIAFLFNSTQRDVDVGWYIDDIRIDGLVAVGERSEESGVAESFQLHQNHPNPFNPSTTISFDLPRASEVTLKIFDLVGHEVATLAQQKMQAGRYNFKWDASGMPGGVYFYRLQTEAFTQTRKLLLLR